MQCYQNVVDDFIFVKHTIPFASLGQDRAAKFPGFVSFQEMPKALSPSHVACLAAKEIDL